MITETEFFGKVAYEANCRAWPPEDSYVGWEKLPEHVKKGWEQVATSVLEVYNDVR